MNFQFRQYQREDMARAALMDGVVFSWEQGLGKSLAAFAMPMIWQSRCVLIVAPGSLHRQLAAEGREKFGVECVGLDTIDDAMADPFLRSRILSTDAPSSEFRAPRFFLTTYQALGMNGADERAAELRTKRGEPYLFLSQNARRLRLETDPESNPVGNEWQGVGSHRDYDHGAAIQCVHRPSLSTVVAHAFDCVVCDEATRMKGDRTYLSEGVRRLDPAKRLVLTGTPIKNRLTDLFWLAHWAAGGHAEPTARWPYADSLESKSDFAAEHLVSERNLTREAQSEADGKRRTYTKQTNEICGLHRLWKLLAPIVLRRRKADIGEDLVTKRIIPMRVPMGRSQSLAYHWYLCNKPEFTKDGEEMARLAAVATQLGNLRLASLCPEAHSLLDHATIDYHDLFREKKADKPTPWHPKNAATLQVVRECLGRGEQVVIFSPFHTWSEWCARTLRSAGVSCERLDGTLSPARRGERAAAFKSGEYAVLIAGLKSMGEGHSFDQCPNLILPSLEWAYDVNAQAIERVHRLTSRQDVRIYTMVAKGTIDERLASLFNEKSDAADLALDGKLFESETEEVNLFKLLQDAIASFDPDAETTPESDVRGEWESNLRPGLQQAHQAWSQRQGATSHPEPKTKNPEPETENRKPNLHHLPKPRVPKRVKVQVDKPRPAITIPFPQNPGIRMTTTTTTTTTDERPSPIPFPPRPGLTDPDTALPVPSAVSAPAPEATDDQPATPANVIAFPGNPSAPGTGSASLPLSERRPRRHTQQAFMFPSLDGTLINLNS